MGGEAPTPGLLGVFIHQSGGNLGGGRGPVDFGDKFDGGMKDWASLLFPVSCQTRISSALGPEIVLNLGSPAQRLSRVMTLSKM